MLEQHGDERVGGGRLAAAAQPGEPHADPLSVARRVRLAEDARHLRPREPLRQRHAGVEVLIAHLGAGDRRRADARGHPRDLLVAVLVGQVRQLAERHHAHSELVGVLGHQLLGVIGPVEGLAGGIVAGPGVIAADDEVVGAVVAQDDRVPEGLAGPGHAHGQRQQREEDAAGRVVTLGEGAIRPHAREVVDVARLRHADRGMQQQHAVHLLGRALGQLLVDPVQRVAGLEGHHVGAAERGQPRARLGRRQAQLLEVVVRGEREHFEAARHVEGAPALHLGHQRVAGVQRAERALGGGGAVPLVDLLDREHRQDLVARVPQGHPRVQARGRLALDGERDGDREQGAAGQPHLGQAPLVVATAHEPVERREAAGGQQLQVAGGAIGDHQRGQPGRLRAERDGGVALGQQAHQPAAVGSNQGSLRGHERSAFEHTGRGRGNVNRPRPGVSPRSAGRPS